MEHNIFGVKLSDSVIEQRTPKHRSLTLVKSHQPEIEMGRTRLPHVMGAVGKDQHGVDPTICKRKIEKIAGSSAIRPLFT